MKLSNRQTVKLSNLIGSFALVALCAAANEPIHWTGGGWDDTGAPKGALLTDNPGWWGRSVFTGVTYSYEKVGTPTNPEDKSGRRLVDAKVFGDWNVPVGVARGPIVAVFDFKRPCVFNEVTLFARRSPSHTAALSFSDDGTNWCEAVSFAASNAIDRIRLEPARNGRYLRLSFKSASGSQSWLDEVLAWGEGEVSEKYPEAIADIPAGDALTFTDRHDGGIEIVPLAKPTLAAAKDKFKVLGSKFLVDGAASGRAADTKVGPPREILLARNETETRYFAVVNASASNRTVRLSPPEFGEGVKTEMRIGGLVRVSRPKVKLTEGQLHDLMVTNTAAVQGGDPEKLDVLPFFAPDAKPAPNFARRNLANPAQVTGFPDAVPLAPGEGCVVMLRVTTDNAAPGRREGAFAATMVPAASSPLREGGGGEADGGSTPCRSEQTRCTPPAAVGGSPLSEEADMSSVAAGDNRQTVKLSNRQTGAEAAPAASLPLTIDVRDATLPDLPIWVFAWSEFTSQFPFESETRYENDVARVAELGVSSCRGLPEPRTKQALLKARVPHTIHWAGHAGGEAWNIAYKNKAGLKEFDERRKAKIAADAHGIVERASALGLKPGEYLTDLPDEPGPWNAELFGDMARTIKEAEPTLQVFMNPCFWLGNGFPPATNMLAVLEPYYNEVIDISCPIRNLVRPGNLLTTNLWTKPRAVNAQYIHPAARAGRSIAWSSFDNGMNGFAYFCYYWPRGNAWDIRTWSWLDFRYQMVFPLENDVAITPIYETMREAWEDYRMLAALRAAGKEALLGELLKSYEKATDYADWENVPNRSDFQSLHDKALGAFAQ